MTYKRVQKDWESERLALRIHSIRQIAVQYEGTEERIISRVPDVSTTGMFINTSRQYAEGAVLNLSFCLALSGLEVNARGEVRYSLPGVGVGVQFIDIPESAIHSIEREIQLSRRIQRPARKGALRKSKGRKLSRRKSNHKSNRRLTARKPSKSKATPRKSR
jgi:PilZ domain